MRIPSATPLKQGDNGGNTKSSNKSPYEVNAAATVPAAPTDTKNYTNVSTVEHLLPSTEHPNVMWTGYGKKTPILLFRAESLVGKKVDAKSIGGKLLALILIVCLDVSS